MRVDSQHHALVDLPPGKCTGAQRAGSWIGARAVWTGEDKRKCLVSTGVRTPNDGGRSQYLDAVS